MPPDSGTHLLHVLLCTLWLSLSCSRADSAGRYLRGLRAGASVPPCTTDPELTWEPGAKRGAHEKPPDLAGPLPGAMQRLAEAAAGHNSLQMRRLHGSALQH